MVICRLLLGVVFVFVGLFAFVLCLLGLVFGWVCCFLCVLLPLHVVFALCSSCF